MSVANAVRRTHRTYTATTGGGGGGSSLPLRTPVESSNALLSRFGVNIHQSSSYTSNLALVYQRLRELNIGWVRILGSPGNTTLRTMMKQISGVDGAGISFIVGQDTKISTLSTDVAAMVAEVQNQYGGAAGNTNGKVIHLEGWNEPDGDETNWVADTRNQNLTLFNQVNATSGAAVSIAAVPVAMSPLTGRSSSWATDLGDESSFIDLGNFHKYTGGRQPEYYFKNGGGPDWAVVNETNSGSLPKIATESGGHTLQNAKTTDSSGNTVNDTHFWTPPEIMGRYGPRYYLAPIWAGLQAVALYEMMDEGTSTTSKEDHFGLYDHTLNPKALATALVNFSALYTYSTGLPAPSLAPLAMDISYGGSDLRWLLHQHGDGSYLLSIWRNVANWTQGYANPYPADAITVTSANVTLTFGSAHTLTLYRPSVQSGAVTGGGSGMTTVTLGLTDDVWVVKIA